MTTLVKTLHEMGLSGEVSLSGRWVELQGERCIVYVVEAASSLHYYTWCDDAETRKVEFYVTAAEAIKAGLRRGGKLSQ